MITEDILIDRENHIGFITLNRPDNNNTFNPSLTESLNNALEELDQDTDIRVVVIRGAGKNFSAGVDLEALRSVENRDYKDFIRLMDRHNHTIAKMKKPVVGAVHGYAVANGCGLAAACDITLAAENARFGITAINVGLICLGPAAPLQKAIGRKRTLEMLLTGKLIDAAEAERIGLVNRVFPDGELDVETIKLAGNLAAKSPPALQCGKTGLYRAEDLPYGESLDLRSRMFADLCATEDAAEGVSAFLEKRSPEWKEK